ncbi:SpnB-like Rossmann fold domain-containing protein, partial [Streptomyces marinisediminis]|uniref:SpnB-like Rossmann fold domain-containing protein n=1 Tax=Streptomyces marinisediminis TaxID=2984864 RepID=UPI002249532D
ADSLFRVGWVPVEPVVGAVGEVSVLDVAGVSGGGGGVVEGVHARVVGVLERVREWLAGAGGGNARLVVVSRGAVDVAGSGVSDLAAAAVWGLVRAAQSEHPDRLILVDTDTDT